MSSHHIVREKQEPALLVLSLENFSPEYLGQLLEWSPTLVATADSFEALNSEGIKVDWLVADKPFNDLQNDVKFIQSLSGNFLGDVLKELIAKGYSAVNIVTEDPDLSLLQHYTDELNLVIYTPTEKIFPIRSGYQKWMPAGEGISLKTWAAELKTSGLEKIDDTTFKTSADGIINIWFDQSYIFIAESI